MIEKSNSLSPSQIRSLLKSATPEARWKRHSDWMKANKKHLAETAFNKLDEIRELLDETPQNSRLILASLKILDEFKARFDVQPRLSLAERFLKGRKVNTISSVRAFIRAQLQKSSALTNEELWIAIAKKPPKGWQAFDNRIGRYLEGPSKDNGDIQNVGYRRFINIAADERKLLRG